jgi:alpha-glucosidase
MFEQLVFTTDPDYFPKNKMREIVSGLRAKNQHYSMSHSCGTSPTNHGGTVMMVDPAIGVRPGISGAYDRGSAAGIWMKEPNGTDYLGSEYSFSVIPECDLTFSSCVAWSHGLA